MVPATGNKENTLSKKSTIARSAAAAAVLAGSLALVLPGTAAAAPSGDVPAPEISAQVNGDAIEMTLTQTSDDPTISCAPMILAAEDALPLATKPLDEWPSMLEMLNMPYFLSTAWTSPDTPTVETDTVQDVGGLMKEITPGAYAVVGACFDMAAEPLPAVASYSYQIVFYPGGTGSLGQALDLGSATLSLDGGLGLIADLLLSGAGSSMLSAYFS